MAKTRGNRRSARHVRFHSCCRCADRDLFRKEISLSAFSFSVVSAANQDLGRNAADWCAGWRGVLAAFRVHYDRLRDHPGLWTGGTSRLRNRRTRDAGPFFTGGGSQFRRFACGGTEFRWSPRGSSPAFRLFCTWHRVVNDAGAHVNGVPFTGNVDSYFFAGSARDRLRQRLSSDRFFEFHFSRNCFCYFQHFPGNRQHAPTVVQLVDTASPVRSPGNVHFAEARL